METILFKSGADLARLIAGRKITCVEVAKQYLDQIKRYNIAINAITDMRDERSILLEARQKDLELEAGRDIGILHGLPVTVKDSYDVKGLISSNGNPRLKRNVATTDAELVRRLKEAGAIVIGKTNMALYALDWQSSNNWFGQTNNPYDLEYVVGGSSGGSAAALASGFTPLELGGDAGGSIRVPAHFCGVCGLRTTESALPSKGFMRTPGAFRIGRYLTTSGPMARNVADLRLMFKALSTGRQYAENPPVMFCQFVHDQKSSIRVAYSDTLDKVELDEEYRNIYHDFIHLLKESRNIEVTKAQPQYNSDRMLELWGRIAGFDLGVALGKIPFKKLITQVYFQAKYKDRQWCSAMGQGAGSTIRDYARALGEKDDISDRFSRFFKDYDIWITPVAATAAFKHQSTGKPISVNGKPLPYTSAFLPFNFPTSVPGHPILTIPIGMTARGLPVGVQVHASKWHDYKLLIIGERLEKVTPGFQIPDMFKEEKLCKTN